ncbi:MAG: glycoside hydrolase family 5 protein [Deltaproteobacteria bacterium]|nr:glycoside hydrolase family 5 protein [Deltaproteobacteria bacterium]MBN2672752.1 glycoside hydrolase family 5 protein [Deltaproteobacteria bacterium]
MTTSKLLFLSLFTILGLTLTACGSKLEPHYSTWDTNPDNGSDSDTPTDSDTATETNSDTGTDTGIELSFDVMDGGYVVAGPWHGYLDTWASGDDSTITPEGFSDALADADICVEGVIGDMPDWSGTALVTMTINEDEARTEVYSWAPEDVTNEGIYIDVSNPGGTELRVQIESGASKWCAVIKETGGTVILWEDFNQACWNNGGNYYAGEPIDHVGVLMPGHNTDDRPYSYCIDEMYPITGYEPVIDTEVDTGDPIDTDRIPTDWNVGFVGEHGMLQAQGGNLVDADGNLVVLRGMSLFWSLWGGQFFNKETVDWLATDWNTNVIRAPLGISGEIQGYLGLPTLEREKVETVVNAAIEAGIYVIIDWHDHNAADHPYDARAFFEVMAQTYGDYPNVIYEIWNEPLPEHDWSGTIKPYADFVIEGIREHDPDNLIVVGTPSWDQQVADPILDPIDDVNVAYVMHFYVGQHTGTLRSRTDSAREAGHTVFITEWGIWEGGYIMPEDPDANEWDGEVDEEKLLEWLDWADENKLSMCMWSANDKDEWSAILKPGASWTGEWAEEDLTTTGTYMRDVFNSYDYDAMAAQ